MAVILYKICTAKEWREAERAGAFHGSEVDIRDGYIHLSAPDQVVETAAKHFAPPPNSPLQGAERREADLVLVAVDSAALGLALKWEPARGGVPFPHVYGPLRLDAVVWVKPLRLGPDGRHEFPELVS
jgi:uncharacterized protein (DUF952 family)